MEKRVAHYNLDAAKATVVQRGVDVFTKTALRGLDGMGLSEADGLSVVQTVPYARTLTQWENRLHKTDIACGCCGDSVQREVIRQR